ncbi:hypothetical protein BZA70DRAFT_285040 [Myxozyma melibiosi]|uniref:DUF1774-domain-containing protein n=1 Tax=Myxozyma melibiosi TaxID=54550 RepID=A0ABR1EYZ4_9ASCO
MDSTISRSSVQRLVAVGSFALAIITNFYYLSGRGIAGNHQSEAFHLEYTPFTPNIVFLFFFWIASYLAQVAFLHQLFAGSSDAQKDASQAAYFLSAFNLLHFLWLVLLAHAHFILAEFVVVLNFLLTGALYWSKRTHNLSPPLKWLTIHFAASALPFAWCLFAIFWTGAVAVHAHNLFARIFANIFIWVLYLFPTASLLVFADWGFAFASAFLVWGLAVGQIFVKTFALQWIFALIIAALLTVQGAVVMFATGFKGLLPADTQASIEDGIENVQNAVRGEETPLIN